MLRITWKKNYQLIYKLTLEQLPIIYFINLKREMIKKKGKNNFFLHGATLGQIYMAR
jgi:hypothetical protein